MAKIMKLRIFEDIMDKTMQTKIELLSFIQWNTFQHFRCNFESLQLSAWNIQEHFHSY